MKKIAIVAQGLNNGGAERVASILANYMSKRGYETLFIAVYSEKREYYLEKNIQFVFLESKEKNKVTRLLSRNRKVYDVLKEFGAEVVFSFITNELLLSEIKGIPIIFSLRNHPQYVDNSFLASHLRNFAYRNAKHVVFQTVGAADFFSGKIRAKSSIIPNPIDTDRFPYWLSAKEHKKEFMTACRLTEQKNLPMMINAFVRFHKTHDEYILKIYGEGELRDVLENQVRELNASEYISLCGHSEDIHEIMKTAACFMLSSNYEGISNSMLEALAIGIPCICTDCPPGGASEFIKDGINGSLIPVGDEDAMVLAMNQLVDNSGIMEKYSENSIKIRERLEVGKICSQWESLV